MVSLSAQPVLQAYVHLVPALEPLGDRVQAGIVATLRLDFGDGGQNVVPVRP